jgi:hypothetical protein
VSTPGPQFENIPVACEIVLDAIAKDLSLSKRDGSRSLQLFLSGFTLHFKVGKECSYMGR